MKWSLENNALTYFDLKRVYKGNLFKEHTHIYKKNVLTHFKLCRVQIPFENVNLIY